MSQYFVSPKPSTASISVQRLWWTCVQFMEMIPEQCFVITLTNHSVQAQILHFTNTQSQFWPDWAGWYNMVCDVKHTYAHVRYVQFRDKVGAMCTLHVPDKAQSGQNCDCALVKWRICSYTEWLVNLIPKHCSRIFSTNCAHVHHSLRTDILAVEGFGLAK